jgi:hypothetical protein
MISAEDRAPTGKCDADRRCTHVPCFQVQLEAASPRKSHRQANACAYHVADVVQALRAWAGEHELMGGQLTILAIEPAAGGRQPGGSGAPGGPEPRGFPFTTIPLMSIQRREPGTPVRQSEERDSARDA